MGRRRKTLLYIHGYLLTANFCQAKISLICFETKPKYLLRTAAAALSFAVFMIAVTL